MTIEQISLLAAAPAVLWLGGWLIAGIFLGFYKLQPAVVTLRISSLGAVYGLASLVYLAVQSVQNVT